MCQFKYVFLRQLLKPLVDLPSSMLQNIDIHPQFHLCTKFFEIYQENGNIFVNCAHTDQLQTTASPTVHTYKLAAQ